MSIQPTPKGSDRKPTATCTCDLCAFEITQPADFERRRSDSWKMNEGQVLGRLTARGWTYVKGTLRCPDCEAKRKGEKPVTKQKPANPVVDFTKPGVTLITPSGGVHQGESVMTALNKHVAEKDAKAAAAASPSTTPPRQPTREQKRQIVALLTDVYDVDAGRFKGVETDKTVADTIGGGVMLGWVAQIREEMFGPDGSNDELAKIEADLSLTAVTMQKTLDGLALALAAFTKERDNAVQRIGVLAGTVREMQGRVQAMKAAIGPRADRF